MAVCTYCKTELKKENCFDIETAKVILLLSKNERLAAVWSNQQKNKGEKAKYSKVFSCGFCNSLYIPSPQMPTSRYLS